MITYESEITRRIELLKSAMMLGDKQLGELMASSKERLSSIRRGKTRFPHVDFIRRLRDLETLYADQIEFYKSGVHPQFYLRAQVNLPNNRQEMVGLAPTNLPGDKETPQRFKVTKLPPTSRATRRLSRRVTQK